SRTPGRYPGTNAAADTGRSALTPSDAGALRRSTEVRRTARPGRSVDARSNRPPLRSRATSSDSRAADTAGGRDTCGEKPETARRDRWPQACRERAVGGRSQDLRAGRLLEGAPNVLVCRWRTAVRPGTKRVWLEPGRARLSRRALSAYPAPVERRR